MKNIRRSIFETNSSSTHSVFIDEKSDLLETIEPVDGVIEIEYGEFGWEQEVYHNPYTKASYALTYSQYGDDSDRRKDMLREVIMNHTGAKEIIFKPISEKGWNGEPDLGDIDHQSVHEHPDIFSSAENLKLFIFNPKSYVETDNDNH